MRRPWLIVLALAVLAAWPAGAAPLKQKAAVAFFGIHFLDTSTEGAYGGVRDDEIRRVAMLEDYVVEQFEAHGFKLVDLTPVAADMDLHANLADCNGCDVLMARKLGADYAMVGLIQKTSNLILAIRLIVNDADSGTMAKGLSVDIRGNTDKTWLRGIRYILRNNVLKD